MDPVSTLFGGGLTGGGGGAGGPSGSMLEGQFNSSGWAVNFGSGSAGASSALDFGQYTPYIVAGAALLIVWRLTRKR